MFTKTFKVTRITIKSDNWCGFRTIAYFIYGDEGRFLDVKEQMYLYTKNNKEICLDYICGGRRWLYDKLIKWMAYGVEPKLRSHINCPSTYWLDGATDCQIAANTFCVPIAVYSSIAPGTKHPDHDSKLFLPFDVPKKLTQPEIMHFVNGNHWESIKIRRAQKMKWPLVSKDYLPIWLACGRNEDNYKISCYFYLDNRVDTMDIWVASIIMHVLQKKLIFTHEILASDTAPLLPIAFIQQVLVPECAVRLIQEDHKNISYEEAFQILYNT